MSYRHHPPLIVIVIALLLSSLGCSAGVLGAAQDQPVRVNDTAQVLKEFSDRLADYKKIHDSVAAKIPSLPDKAEPHAIAAHEKLLADGIRRARATAKPGDLLTPDVRHHIRRLLWAALGGKDGAPERASINDENIK